MAVATGGEHAPLNGQITNGVQPGIGQGSSRRTPACQVGPHLQFLSPEMAGSSTKRAHSGPAGRAGHRFWREDARRTLVWNQPAAGSDGGRAARHPNHRID